MLKVILLIGLTAATFSSPQTAEAAAADSSRTVGLYLVSYQQP